MIDVKNISFKYAGSKHLVFDDFSLTLEENRIYGLLGKNGTGKSTLLYLLSGLLRPSCGSVCCDGIATKDREPETLRDIFLVTEEFEMPAICLSEYVKLYKPFYPNFSDEILQGCLADFELPADVRLGELSMGQRKKAYIAFAMATNTKYLLMDEPTNGLDIPSKSQFRKVIAQHMTEERTVVISTHQVHDVEQMLDHILMLDQHSVLLNASMQEIQDAYTFEFRSPQQMDDTVLYAEPTLQGNAVITQRRLDNILQILVQLYLLVFHSMQMTDAFGVNEVHILFPVFTNPKDEVWIETSILEEADTFAADVSQQIYFSSFAMLLIITLKVIDKLSFALIHSHRIDFHHLIFTWLVMLVQVHHWVKQMLGEVQSLEVLVLNTTQAIQRTLAHFLLNTL